MNNYTQATDQIMKYLETNQYCHTLLSANRMCFSRLEEYLSSQEISYTPQAAEKWYESIKEELSVQQKSFYRMSLLRLQDVFECGEIHLDHDTKHLKAYTILHHELKKELDEFLKSLAVNDSPDTIRGYKHPCARFLIYFQKKGVLNPCDITYEMFISFYDENVHQGRWGKSILNRKVSVMIEYFFHKNVFPYGFTVLFHYLSLGKGCYWNDVSDAVHERIQLLLKEGDGVSVEQLVQYKNVSDQFHADNGYSKVVRSVNNRAADLLILFLDMNGYRYSPAIAMAWMNGCIHRLGTEINSFRRALCLIAQYHESSVIKAESVFRVKPRAFELIPEWCKQAAESYVKSKIQEGWGLSTLNMIRSSIVRFCNYLDAAGIRSFKDITSAHIRQFNADDIHKTPAGKNAYNTRIRKFLIYLGEKGHLTNPMLFISLSCKSAPKETIVVVLTDSEMKQLNDAIQSEDSVLSLRKKAMLLLGLKMGLRSSDIVNLRYSDIHWSEASIRFIQKKTEVKVNLPMPAEVGNALFRYITEERGQNKSPNIFLSEKAPHKAVGRAACRKALNTALPDRKVEGSGFHVTRKTYATALLRNGVGADVVAEALGQRGTSSVHRYLSLDQERMRMCALELDSCGIGGWSHDR